MAQYDQTEERNCEWSEVGECELEDVVEAEEWA